MSLTKKGLPAIVIIFLLLAGCAGVPVRPALQEDIRIPSGKIEGNQFTGIRYPFKVSVPSHWKMTTEFPDFLTEFGYDKPSPTDKEQTELYAYHPATKSNISFDFTPANRGFIASQQVMEGLVGMGASSLQGELEKEGIRAEIGPTESINLKGVQYAARKSATYTVNGVKREQGWIYGFTEPYQIFILYTILENEGTSDRQDLKKILDSFEVIPKK